MNYAKIKKNSTANWVGISVSLYCQGCEFKCPHCFNKETWNPEGGKPFTDEVKKAMFEELKKSYYDALVLLGGELFTSSTLTLIAKANKSATWCQVFKNWATVYFGNLIGALFVVLIIFVGRTYMNFGTEWGHVILNTALHKIEHIYPSDGSGLYAYFRGFLYPIFYDIRYSRIF